MTGKGNQKAYLAEVGRPVFELLINDAEWNSLAVVNLFAIDSVLARIEDAVEMRINESPDLDSTTKQQLVLARHGQGLFRTRISEFVRAAPKRSTRRSTPATSDSFALEPARSSNQNPCLSAAITSNETSGRSSL